MTNHPFLTAAETRAAHLRELSLHLRALEIEAADLSDVDREITELEAAMAVYRRLHSTGTALVEGAIPRTEDRPDSRQAEPASTSPAPAQRAAAPSTRRAPARRRTETPSFKDFTRSHLDRFGDGGETEGNGSHADGSDSFSAALQPPQPPRGFPAS